MDIKTGDIVEFGSEREVYRYGKVIEIMTVKESQLNGRKGITLYEVNSFSLDSNIELTEDEITKVYREISGSDK